MLKYLDRAAAVNFICELGVPMAASALEKLASVRAGPRYCIINGRALYREAELLAWLETQAARPFKVTSIGRPRKAKPAPGDAPGDAPENKPLATARTG